MQNKARDLSLITSSNERVDEMEQELSMKRVMDGKEAHVKNEMILRRRCLFGLNCFYIFHIDSFQNKL